MKQKLLLMSLMISINLFALECNEASFNKGNEEMRHIYLLYNETTVSPEEQEAISKSKISKENYAQDMKILENKLATLQKSRVSLSQASMFNTINIGTWKDLENTCHGKYLSAVQQARANAESMQRSIQQRLDTIKGHINRTEMVITIGKKKYSVD